MNQTDQFNVKCGDLTPDFDFDPNSTTFDYFISSLFHYSQACWKKQMYIIFTQPVP